MRKMATLLLVGAVFALPCSPPAFPDDEKQTNDKAEQERRKREEKAQQKELREARENKEVLEEIQGEIDAQALLLKENLYRDRFLQDYVNELGQALVPRETPRKLLFSFRVVHDWPPNAWALPDGRIYVTAGLLSFVKSEAELAVVLGHEIGHVLEQHQVEAIRESRSVKRRLLPGMIGAAAGAIFGGAIKGKEGATAGAAMGAVGGLAVAAIDFNRYGRKQEDEADNHGVRLALTRGYDAREGVSFFQRLTERFGDDDPLSNFLYARHSRNVDRVRYIQQLLDGEMSALYNEQRAAGQLTLGTGQMHLFASRMFRDMAVYWMDEADRYDIARGVLEDILDYRMRDPKTLWALGRAYKMVGRTPEDRTKALDFLQRAASLDERNRYPEIWRDLGRMQARMAAEGQMAPAIESLKKYVRGYQDRYSVDPPDLDEMYDYLLVFGDSQWTAPRMENSVLRAAATPPPPTRPAAPPAGSKTAVAPPAKKKPGQP